MPEVTPIAVVLWAACFLLIVGLFVRGRWRLNLLFTAYNIIDLATALLPVFWPARFYRGAFFILTQGLNDILKIGVVLEVAWRTFRVFPGAASATRRLVIGLLAATTLAAIVTPLANTRANSYESSLADFHPRVMDGTIWLVAATLGVAWFYRVPVRPFHSAVLTSLAIYVAFYGTLLRLVSRYDFQVYRPYLNNINYIVFFVITGWWAYLAWRPERASDQAHTRTVQKLPFPPSLSGGPEDSPSEFLTMTAPSHE
jgi:hypothetical protein